MSSVDVAGGTVAGGVAADLDVGLRGVDEVRAGLYRIKDRGRFGVHNWEVIDLPDIEDRIGRSRQLETSFGRFSYSPISANSTRRNSASSSLSSATPSSANPTSMSRLEFRTIFERRILGCRVASAWVGS